MEVHGITPILNVSDLAMSFAWFQTLGWRKCWEWGTPPTFGAVGSGNVELFLCQNAQGGRGKGSNTSTSSGSQSHDHGVWMTWWVEDVDDVYATCMKHGLDVTQPPTNEPWNVREMHLRHPDGHIFRISRGIHRT